MCKSFVSRPVKEQSHVCVRVLCLYIICATESAFRVFVNANVIQTLSKVGEKKVSKAFIHLIVWSCGRFTMQ